MRNIPEKMKRFKTWLLLATAGTFALSATLAGTVPSDYTEPLSLSKPRGILSSYTLVSGVVVDPARGVVYIMRPGGGIEALDLDDGAVRWTTDRADQPLFVAQDVLLARVESTSPGFVVALLDPASGVPAGSTGPLVLPLPRGVVAGIDQTLERSFTHSVLESGNEAYLTWEYIEHVPTGVSPPGGRAFVRRETGAFRFHSGRFEAATPGSVSTQRWEWPPQVRKLLDSKRLRRPPWRTDGILAIAEQRYGPDQLALRRWRRSDGAELEEKKLCSGRAIAVLASCDERHIVVATASGRSVPEPQYLLRFFALDTGNEVATVLSKRSAGPFCLLGSRLLRLSFPEKLRVEGILVDKPLALVAVDVESGAEVWRRAFRDTAFRGLPPPQR